jgi:predicted nucleic acid-binding protein
MELIADTSFLVGLWRGQQWAQSFARANSSRSLGLPWVVQGEFWHGAIRAGHDPEKVRNFLSIGVPLNDPEPVVHTYAHICSALQDSPVYHSIGQNDLWIAAVAVTFALPLVTRNIRYFGHIKGLRVEALKTA